MEQYTQDEKVLLAIENLLFTSGRESWNVISVNEEANHYCFKTVDGKVDTVKKSFLNDRINAGLISRFRTVHPDSKPSSFNAWAKDIHAQINGRYQCSK